MQLFRVWEAGNERAAYDYSGGAWEWKQMTTVPIQLGLLRSFHRDRASVKCGKDVINGRKAFLSDARELSTLMCEYRKVTLYALVGS